MTTYEAKVWFDANDLDDACDVLDCLVDAIIKDGREYMGGVLAELPETERPTGSEGEKWWECDPHDYQGKMIHVGTPGIFHRPGDSFYTVTACGRDGTDCRATDHRLEDYQPCVVCWPPASRPKAVVPPDQADLGPGEPRRGPSGGAEVPAP